MRPRSAFTLIEVLASLLVISIGMMGVIALIWYALTLADRGRAGSTAMATALTVLDDPTPSDAVDWTHSPCPQSNGAGESRGWLNGYYVRRSEVAAEPAADGLSSTAIRVEVFQSTTGSPVASLATRRMTRR